jgi:hypothetical protein
MSRISPRRLGLATGGIGIVTALVVIPNGAHAAPPLPSVRLLTGVTHIEVDRFGTESQLFISDPAFVAATNGAFEIDPVRRNGRILLPQVVRSGSHTSVVRTIRPVGQVRMGTGLPDFFTLTMRNHDGAVVSAAKVPFCPGGSFDTQRVDPNSPSAPSYPQQCGDKLTHATVWGIDRGWADGMFSDLRASVAKAPDGNYGLTVRVTKSYADQLHIPAANQAVRVVLNLKTESDGCIDICPFQGLGAHPSTAAIRRAVIRQSRPSTVPAVGPAIGVGPGGSGPSAAAFGLPDLIALPSHDLSVRHVKRSGQDWLDFAATIWNAGPGSFDIEGFRHDHRPTMQARQYIEHPDGRATSTKIGTFEFDTRPGHDHWHLEDVARYTLLDAAGRKVVRSHKQSFCLAPTDPVNLTRRGADWVPDSVGLESSCPTDQSLWLREALPVGWGDTYVQAAGGQSFNITNSPNGTYLVRVTVNPNGIIHEITRSNDSSYLKITLGGTPGARTVSTVGPVTAP